MSIANREVQKKQAQVEKFKKYQMELQPPETVYGVLFVELDQVGSRDEYVAAYGEWRFVQLYKEQFNLKGETKVYKTKTWLVKRLEKLKGMYGDHVQLVNVDPKRKK